MKESPCVQSRNNVSCVLDQLVEFVESDAEQLVVRHNQEEVAKVPAHNNVYTSDGD
jgi:hypothetical protein